MRRMMVAVLVALLAVPAPAWETDLHYGLTKWLAVKAGFSLDEAEIIAAGTQSADDSPTLSAPSLVKGYMCFLHHDAIASRLVQQNHFPSYATIPEASAARAVHAGDDAATRWTQMELAVAAKGAPGSIVLYRFGSSLHPLEDSWSHAGEPDTEPLCDKQLTWGHPQSRGGWRSHDADITFKHVQDTEDTAHSVFDQLVQLHKRIGGPGQPTSWTAIQAAVHQFAIAATKTDKLAWFQSDSAVPYTSYKRRCFLDHISIPDGPKYTCPAAAPANYPTMPLPPAASDAEKFTREFLQQWIVDQKIDLAAQQFDRESLGTEHRVDLGNERLVRNMLLVWLNPDHGIANASMHGTSLDFAPELRERLETNRIKFADISNAIRVPGTDLPYMFTPIPKAEGVRAEYAATFQIITAPRDRLSIGVAHGATGWKIVSFDWVAF